MADYAAPEAPDHTKEMPDIGVWAEFAAPESTPFPCQVVKLVWAPDGTVYFMNTKDHKYHYNFLVRLSLESRCDF